VATCPSGHESASGDFCDVCGVLIGAAPSLGTGLAADAGAAPLAGDGTAGGTLTATPGWSEACPRCGTPRDGQFCEACGHNFAAAPSAAAWLAPDPAVPAAGAANAQVPGAEPASVQVPDAQVPGAHVPGAQVPDAQATVDPWPAVSVPAGPVPGTPGPAAPAPAGVAWTAVVSADRAYYDSVRAAGGPDTASIEFPAYSPQRRFPLDRAEVRIGRRSASSGITPEIDLSVPPADPGISRLHAVLLRAADGSWAIVDPGSANGTLLNGAELAAGQVVPVRDGDRIHLGAWTELRLTCG
jgi:hypothetical protein